MLDAIARFLISTGKLFKSMDEPRSKKPQTAAETQESGDESASVAEDVNLE